MQKWEYMTVARNRKWVFPEDDTVYLSPADWEYYLWFRGAKQPQKWQGVSLVDLLCELGDQGWELVEAHPRSDYLGHLATAKHGTGHSTDFAGFTSSETFTFKRPKNG